MSYRSQLKEAKIEQERENKEEQEEEEGCKAGRRKGGGEGEWHGDKEMGAKL